MGTDYKAKIHGKDAWNTLCDLIVLDPDSMGAHTDYRGIESQMKEFFKREIPDFEAYTEEGESD